MTVMTLMYRDDRDDRDDLSFSLLIFVSFCFVRREEQGLVNQDGELTTHSNSRDRDRSDERDGRDGMDGMDGRDGRSRERDGSDNGREGSTEEEGHYQRERNRAQMRAAHISMQVHH